MSSRLMHYASTSFDVKLASYENIIKDEFVYSQSNNKLTVKSFSVPWRPIGPASAYLQRMRVIDTPGWNTSPFTSSIICVTKDSQFKRKGKQRVSLWATIYLDNNGQRTCGNSHSSWKQSGIPGCSACVLLVYRVIYYWYFLYALDNRIIEL